MKRIHIQRIAVLVVLVFAGAIIGYFVVNGTLPVVSDRQEARVSAAEMADIDPNRFYKVTEVIDGDTFKVMIDREEITVRMLGIDTPEVVDPRKPAQCYGNEASARSKSILGDGEVKLVLNPEREKTDKYARLLAYVYGRDGLFVNRYLIQEGFAREYTFGKVYQYQEEFKSIEKQAREAGKGLWGKCSGS